MGWRQVLKLSALVAAIALPACSQTSAKSAPPDPAAFVRGVYARYAEPAFCPTCDEAPQVFDAPMVALLAEDGRLTQEGDQGAIEADPLCQCQDSDGLVATVDPTGRSVALAFPSGERVSIRLDLALQDGQWRIHDVHAPDMPSLRDHLVRANAERAPGRP